MSTQMSTHANDVAVSSIQNKKNKLVTSAWQQRDTPPARHRIVMEISTG